MAGIIRITLIDGISIVVLDLPRVSAAQTSTLTLGSDSAEYILGIPRLGIRRPFRHRRPSIDGDTDTAPNTYGTRIYYATLQPRNRADASGWADRG